MPRKDEGLTHTFDSLQRLISATGQYSGCLPPKSTYAPRWSTLQLADRPQVSAH